MSDDAIPRFDLLAPATEDERLNELDRWVRRRALQLKDSADLNGSPAVQALRQATLFGHIPADLEPGSMTACIAQAVDEQGAMFAAGLLPAKLWPRLCSRRTQRAADVATSAGLVPLEAHDAG